jgi:hypothetical protein
VPTLCTFTQGGWGSTCHGNNPGCLRDQYFSTAFPAGLLIGGDQASALWTTSAAIAAYLPAGGPPAALSGHATNPTGTAAGVLGGQQTAAKLNVGIVGSPAQYVFVGCVKTALIGTSVASVIEMADEAMSSGSAPPGLSFSDLSDALTVFNENYDECRNGGCLAPPSLGGPPPTPRLHAIGGGRPRLPHF